MFSLERYRKRQRGFTLVEVLMTLSILALLAGIAVPVVLHLRGGADTKIAEAELAEIQAAVDTMMADSELGTLPNPVTTATDDMSSFPDDDYVLYGNATARYTRIATTQYSYYCDSSGQVYRYSVGSLPIPMAQWHFNEGSGVTAEDSSSSYDGDLYGAGWTTGISGNATSFDGNAAYIEVVGFPNLQSDFTITAWIYTTDNVETGQRIFADDESNSGGYALSLGDPGAGALRFYSRSMDTVSLDTVGGVIQDDQWCFVAAVVDITNQDRIIYVGTIGSGSVDEKASDTTDTGTWGTDVGDASIGGETAAGESTNCFEGYIDEMAIYSRALTQEELQDIYDAQKP